MSSTQLCNILQYKDFRARPRQGREHAHEQRGTLAFPIRIQIESRKITARGASNAHIYVLHDLTNRANPCLINSQTNVTKQHGIGAVMPMLILKKRQRVFIRRGYDLGSMKLSRFSNGSYTAAQISHCQRRFLKQLRAKARALAVRTRFWLPSASFHE